MKKISTLVISMILILPSTGFSMESDDTFIMDENERLEALFRSGRAEAARMHDLSRVRYPTPGVNQRATGNDENAMLQSTRGQSFYIKHFPRRNPSQHFFKMTQEESGSY